jgi:hypothetical protein
MGITRCCGSCWTCARDLEQARRCQGGSSPVGTCATACCTNGVPAWLIPAALTRTARMATARRTSVARYLRVSRNDQKTDLQGDETEEFIARRGWTLVDTFTDEGISGSRDHLPGLDAMMKAAHQAASPKAVPPSVAGSDASVAIEPTPPRAWARGAVTAIRCRLAIFLPDRPDATEPTARPLRGRRWGLAVHTDRLPGAVECALCRGQPVGVAVETGKCFRGPRLRVLRWVILPTHLDATAG